MTHPADPAALFIELYDQLPEEVFLRPDPEVWKRDPDVQRHARRMCDYIQEFGEAEPRQVQEIIDKDGDRGVFAVLRGIDLALEIINPWFPSFLYGNLAELTSRYAQTGRLNASAADGALLPRAAYPNRPKAPGGKASYFALHGFYMWLDNYIYTQALTADFSGFTPPPDQLSQIPPGVILSNIGQLTAPANGT